jgi:hypothetical protein
MRRRTVGPLPAAHQARARFLALRLSLGPLPGKRPSRFARPAASVGCVLTHRVNQELYINYNTAFLSNRINKVCSEIEDYYKAEFMSFEDDPALSAERDANDDDEASQS